MPPIKIAFGVSIIPRGTKKIIKSTPVERFIFEKIAFKCKNRYNLTKKLYILKIYIYDDVLKFKIDCTTGVLLAIF